MYANHQELCIPLTNKMQRKTCKKCILSDNVALPLLKKLTHGYKHIM